MDHFIKDLKNNHFPTKIPNFILEELPILGRICSTLKENLISLMRKNLLLAEYQQEE
jgi:hypothetical protein